MAKKIEGKWHCASCNGYYDIKEYPDNCPDCGFSRKDSECIESGNCWYCEKCEITVKKGEKCPKCGQTELGEPIKTWECEWCHENNSEKDHPKKCPICGHKRGTSPPPPTTWDCHWCKATGLLEEDYPDKCPLCGHDRDTYPPPRTVKTWECKWCHEKISEKDYPDECPICKHRRGTGPGKDKGDGDGPKPAGPSWRCKKCDLDIDATKHPYKCPICGRPRYPDKELDKEYTDEVVDPKSHLPITKIIAVIALIAIVYLFVLPMVTNPDVPLIQFGDGSGSVEQTPTVSPTESVILGAFTVTDGQNPSMSASLADGQTGVVYSNTLSFPYGSPYYVLSITDVIPPVTITASNLVPTNTQASLELQLKDSDGNTVDTIQLGSSDTKRSKKITIREAGNYILIIDGKYVESVVITIEKT